MKQVYLLLIFLIVLSSICFAAPPVTTVQSFSEGYVIKAPIQEFHKYNTEYRFNFHVFNISNGMPLVNSSSISCEFHLYNSSGNHLYTSTSYVVDHTYDYQFLVGGGNFTNIDEYHYVFQCNTSTLGGFVEDYFFVTNDGLNNTPNTYAGLPILFFMLFIIIGLFVLGFTGKFNKHEIINLVLCRGCVVTAIMITMYNTTLMANLVNYANLDVLTKEMFFLMTWIGWAGYLAAVYLVIQTLFDILRLKKERRAKKINEVRY